MMKLASKMTTEELAEFLGVAKQTVNRWVREQGWSTELIPGVKGGRARLILIDKQVRQYIMKTPSMRQRQLSYSIAEPTVPYANPSMTGLLPEITRALQNMTDDEQYQLARMLAREGIRGFLSRLGIEQVVEE